MSENEIDIIEVDGQQTLEGMPEPEPIEIEEFNLETVITDLTASLDDADITPYAIHKVVNGVFEIFGAEKRIPPQQMYLYDRNGMIVKGAKGQKRYTKNEVQLFVYKYTHNKI